MSAFNAHAITIASNKDVKEPRSPRCAGQRFVCHKAMQLFALALLLTPVCGRSGKFDITIANAQGLPNKDGWFGKSDPYVLVKRGVDSNGDGGTECGRTTTTWDEESPTWDEGISCGCVDSSTRIGVRVYDEDSNEPDDKIGGFSGPASVLPLWIQRTVDTGSLSFAISFDTDNDECSAASPVAASPPVAAPTSPGNSYCDDEKAACTKHCSTQGLATLINDCTGSSSAAFIKQCACGGSSSSSSSSVSTNTGLGVAGSKTCKQNVCGCECTSTGDWTYCYSDSEVADFIDSTLGGCGGEALAKYAGSCAEAGAVVEANLPFTYSATCKTEEEGDKLSPEKITYIILGVLSCLGVICIGFTCACCTDKACGLFKKKEPIATITGAVTEIPMGRPATTHEASGKLVLVTVSDQI